VNQRTIFQHRRSGDVAVAQAIEGDRLSSAQTCELILTGWVQHGHGPVVDLRAFKRYGGRPPVQSWLLGNHPSDSQPCSLEALVGGGTVAGVRRHQRGGLNGNGGGLRCNGGKEQNSRKNAHSSV